jgi:serine/threonine protein kinase
MIGRRLLHYEIVEKLGEGGMGVVYKARDTHLDRFVALKVLPPERVADPVRKARFVQEAKAASALNHPNIITIHDISSDAGHDFIVMEYVAGKTLDQLIPRKGMRLGETLKIAVQIADALARAHAAGIIHRDLKPANVMVDEHGLVKVLDFGLAKLIEQGLSEDESTATIAVKTDEGAIVGTVAYMSPEQAEGKKLDARLDIFSFGAVLYEMVAGQRAFQGDSKMSTLSAVLHKEPAPLPGETPRELGRIVTRCLRKDPERRFQHMADVKVALEELKEESDSGKLVSSRAVAWPAKRSRLWLAVAAAVLVILGAGGWLLSSRLRVRGPAAAIQAVPLTTFPGSEVEPSLSPDGSQAAFAWNGEKQENFNIYVKLVGPGKPIRLTDSSAMERSPAWSPDGRWIVFARFPDPGKAEIILIPALGGPERKLAESSGVPPFEGIEMPLLAWSPDSRWIVARNANGPAEWGLVAINVETGERQKLTGDMNDFGPAFSPDGRRLVFAHLAGILLSDIYSLSVSDSLKPRGEPKRLTYEDRWAAGPAWTPDGRQIIFSCGELGGNRGLYRIPADGSTRTAERLAGAGEGTQSITIVRKGASSRLVCSRGGVKVGMWETGLSAAGDPLGPPREVAPSTAADLLADYSPDGGRIVFTHRYRGEERPFVVSVAGGAPRPLTSGKEQYTDPVFSADGRWIYLSLVLSLDGEICKMPSDGSRQPLRVVEGNGRVPLPSADGRFLYYAKTWSPADIWQVPINSEGEASGGGHRAVFPVQDATTWALADRGIFFCPLAKPDEKASIRFLDLAAGQAEPVLLLEKRPHQGMTAWRDGSRVLWTQVDQVVSDLMLVENFR